MLSVLEPTRSPAASAARFDDLFRRLYPGLVGLGTRLIGERTEAEDVVQEVFVKLADDPVLARPDDEVAAWLRRVVLNLGMNRIRDRRRAADRVDRAARLGAALADGEPDGPAREALRHEARDQVRAALAELPERQRACLLLRHAGHSYAEIAATLGVAVGSVGVLLARAERAFRERYRERYPELILEAPPSQEASSSPGAPASQTSGESDRTDAPRRPRPPHENAPSTEAAPSLHSLQEHTDDRHLP